MLTAKITKFNKLPYKIVKVPLSKLHFETYDWEHGEKIEMGDGVPIYNSRWRAWTDEIDPLLVMEVTFPAFSYEGCYKGNHKEEPMATLKVLTLHV